MLSELPGGGNQLSAYDFQRSNSFLMEASVRIPLAKSFLLGTAFVVGLAVPAGAQTLGVGVSFLDDFGTGVTLDYFKPTSTSTDRSSGWVGDFSWHHKGYGGDLFGAEFDVTALTFQGGYRIQGTGGDNLKWHAQGLVGLARGSFTASAAGISEDVCDLLDLDCSAGASDSGLIVSPGVGVDYAFNERRAFRGQLDILIGEGGVSPRFWFGLSMRLD
jgi:hypothetical protein